jgi:uncharacterized membrane protein HdeD (DUF308 family)
MYLVDSITFSSFGLILLLTWPLIEVAPELFRVFFGIFATANGILMLMVCYLYRKETYFKAILSNGCIGILVGLFVLIRSAGNKDIDEHTLILFIASWFFVKGFLHFYLPIKFKKKYQFILNRLYYLIGASELAFGIILLFGLKSNSFPLIWSVGIYFIFAGSFIFIYFLKNKSAPQQNESI